MKQSIESVAKKCSSFKSTGKPWRPRKISFTKILAEFNHILQVDFLYIAELDNKPILHFVDMATSFSITFILPSLEHEDFSKAIETVRCNIHGSPHTLNYYFGFSSTNLDDSLKYLDINGAPCPARRHSKTGVVENNNGILRTLAQRILADANSSKKHGVSSSFMKISSHAQYIHPHFWTSATTDHYLNHFGALGKSFQTITAKNSEGNKSKRTS